MKSSVVVVYLWILNEKAFWKLNAKFVQLHVKELKLEKLQGSSIVK